jgi:hypothetical protein
MTYTELSQRKSVLDVLVVELAQPQLLSWKQAPKLLRKLQLQQQRKLQQQQRKLQRPQQRKLQRMTQRKRLQKKKRKTELFY